MNNGSQLEMLGRFGLYAGSIPWDHLKGFVAPDGTPDSGERPYTLAKTFILMYSKELARRLQGSGVDVFAGKRGGGGGEGECRAVGWTCLQVRHREGRVRV